MGNTDTFRTAKLPSAEINLGGTATTEATFLDTAGNYLTCYVPGSGALSFKPFRIYAAGRCIAGTGTPNFTASFYWGAGNTIYTASTQTKIASTGAVAIATTQGSWELVWDGLWDNTSRRLIGRMSGFVYATAVAVAIGSSIATSVDLNTATTSEGQGISITGTFSAGNASNKAYVDVFELTAR